MNKKITEAATALKFLENARGNDFYTVEYQNALSVAMGALKEKVNPSAHWIFSGDPEDYDGYYINCSQCGIQRKVYNRDYERDLPVACPACGERMNLAVWEDQLNQSFRVVVFHDNGKHSNLHTMTVRAENAEEAKGKAIADVMSKLNYRCLEEDLYIDSVKAIN